jgi:hypothetical protein
MTLAIKVSLLEGDLVRSISTNLFLMNNCKFFSQCSKKTSTITKRIACMKRSDIG